MSDIRRSEWLKVDDVISADFYKGPNYQVTEVTAEKGIQVRLINSIEGYEVYQFISDADPVEYFKITNVAGEFDTAKHNESLKDV